jgi:bifunctional non-homologous end joining protein LigD
MFAEAARLKLEGIVSKRLGRPYTGRRSPDWLKVKCSLREEFVIGGFTTPSGGRKHFGALAIGYYDHSGDFIYAGRVGTGFSEATLVSLREKFTDLIQKDSPFKNLSGRTGQAKGVTWLKPSLIAQVEFSNWTDDGQLRHPSFQGLREDKNAKDIVRDDPISPTTIESSEKAARLPKRKQQRVSVTGPPGKRSARTTDTATDVAGVHLSHPDKILYPQDNITKLDLARYYEQVVDWMLPHVENRLLSLVRCPGGSGQKCFFQKHPGNGTSDGLRRFSVREKNKVEEHLALYDLAGLVSLVQIGVLEIHIWGSQADRYEKPDRLIFDLDPDPAVEWPEVVTAAKEVRLLLEELGLESFIKTTGGKGLHVVLPIQRRTSWDDAKAFCLAVADFMVAAAPKRYIAKMSKAARKGKIYVDYLRNDLGSTAIAPYSTRNRAGAPVSVPITWDELSSRMKSDHFNIHNLPARLAKLTKDPWAGITKTKQCITASMLKKLQLL